MSGQWCVDGAWGQPKYFKGGMTITFSLQKMEGVWEIIIGEVTTS